jgi:hypothetical protein
MTSEYVVAHLLTNRDYGPLCAHIALRFPPSLSSRRLNFAFPRGELARPTLGIR